MREKTREKQDMHEVESGADNLYSMPPVPQVHAQALPPGVGPQIDLDAQARLADGEPFLAPAPQRDRMILGYGHSRVGRMPPYGGSPTSGPLTGLPQRGVRPPPVPAAFARQVLEPGHQEPDPLKKLPFAEVDPRAPQEVMFEAVETIGRSAAALRSIPEFRSGGSGRHAPVGGAVGPVGSGGARVGTSIGLRQVDAAKTSDRGLYVAGSASGARWDVSGAVSERRHRSGDDCAAGAKPRAPLSPLNSLKGYSRQVAAVQAKEHQQPDPLSYRPPEVRDAPPSGPGFKGYSKAFKGLAHMPSLPEVPLPPPLPDTTTPDLESERRLLAARAALSGLGGRFGARRPCRPMDMIEALRPSAARLEWRREKRRLGESASQAVPGPEKQTRGGRGQFVDRGSAEVSPATPKARGASGGAAQPKSALDTACRPVQKYPAAAGVG